MTIDDIEREITAQQLLQRQYEEQLSYTTDPREKQRLQVEIRKIKFYVLGLQTELRQLREAAEPEPAADPAEPSELPQTTPAEKLSEPEPSAPESLPLEPYITNYLNPYEPIPHHAQAVLKKMFAKENEVTVHKRFGRGLSGSLVYIIRIGNKLPNVVKIDYYEKIMQEWDAFTTYIDEQMPSAILGRDRPSQPTGSDHAGLRYPLAGSGIFEVRGLYDFLSERETAEGQKYLIASLQPFAPSMAAVSKDRSGFKRPMTTPCHKIWSSTVAKTPAGVGRLPQNKFAPSSLTQPMPFRSAQRGLSLNICAKRRA